MIEAIVKALRESGAAFTVTCVGEKAIFEVQMTDTVTCGAAPVDLTQAGALQVRVTRDREILTSLQLGAVGVFRKNREVTVKFDSEIHACSFVSALAPILVANT